MSNDLDQKHSGNEGSHRGENKPSDAFTIDPAYRERFSNFDGSGGSVLVPIAITFTSVIAILAAAYIYIVSYPVPSALGPIKAALTPAPPPSPYLGVYEKFGITMPANFERLNPSVVRYLDQFRREPCDSGAIMPFMRALADTGYPREAGLSGWAFVNGCQFYDDVAESSIAYFQRLNDYQSALAVSEIAVKHDRASGRYRYFRGMAHEGLKDHKAALNDYISTLQLFTDLSKVALSEFYRISRMYAAIGQHCDAITPLETYIAYDLNKRQTAQLSRIITDYANAGNCRGKYANGGDRVTVGQRNLVDVVINGARGRMIVDTGASSVSISPSFASRAKVAIDDKNMVTSYVVGGTVQMALTNAQLVQVGNTSAANVPVTVTVGNDAAFGPQIDGLLGMTYLARFNVMLSGGVLELKPNPLN